MSYKTKAEEKANELTEELGPDGAWVQAADEFHNSFDNEERHYWSEVMSYLDVPNCYKN